MMLRNLPLHFSKEAHYIMLFVASIVLMVWQYFGMETQLRIIPDVELHYPPSIHSDHINGGVSITRLSTDGGRVAFDCNIKRSDTFAFCGVSIPIAMASGEGIDISHYEYMDIELEFLSDVKDTLLVYMINEERAASGIAILKSNLRAIYAELGVAQYSLPISQFFVPSWWLFQNGHEGVSAEPRIDNVMSLQLTTGDNTLPRDTRVVIRSISFHGKLVSAADLYLWLLASWLLLFLMRVLKSMKGMSENIRETHRHNQELIVLNHFLSIQKDQYETMAKFDKLTGALNRAGARDVLEQIIKDSKSLNVFSALLAIDIDHFKQINDEYGHDVGDAALRNLVSLIESNTRDIDKLVRWGGEEFMLICPDTKLQSAMMLAEKLRTIIDDTSLITETFITCSFGVAILQDESIDEWFKRADRALYQAKNSGRNCIRSAD